MAERYDFYVHDNRKITFNLTEPIMREDSGVTDFVFHIPKVLNELEVSDWQWWFVFVNAKKEKYSIALTLSDDPESPLEKNVATYTVDYAMSIKAGSVQFALEAINTGTGGAIDNEWHTLTYETKVKETLQGNQAEYAETESDIISALLQEVRTKMNQVIGGATPTPVASVSAMTDPSRLYLLTTDGEWYYHNGTQFVSGGVYGAGIVDSVPTQGSNNAVSSGGVYSALASVEADVSDIQTAISTEVKSKNLINPDALTVGRLQADGTTNTMSSYATSDYILLEPGDYIFAREKLTDGTASAMSYAGYGFYDLTKTWIANSRVWDNWGAGVTLPITITEPCYIRVCGSAGFFATDSPTSDTALYILQAGTALDGYEAYHEPQREYNAVKKSDIEQTAGESETKLMSQKAIKEFVEASAGGDVNEIAPYVVGKNIYNPAECDPQNEIYYDASGVEKPALNYAITGKIPVEAETEYIFSATAFSMQYSSVCYFSGENGETFISKETINGASFTTPGNCTHIDINLFGRTHTEQNFADAIAVAQLEVGTVATAYEPYYKKRMVSPSNIVGGDKIDAVAEITANQSQINLYDKTLAVDGKYLNAGNEQSNANWAYTGKIPVQPNTQYCISRDPSTNLPLTGNVYSYGADGSYLGTIKPVSYVYGYLFAFVTPSNVYTIAVNMRLDSHTSQDFEDTINSMMLCYGTQRPLAYAPYNPEAVVSVNKLSDAYFNPDCFAGKKWLAIGTSITWYDSKLYQAGVHTGGICRGYVGNVARRKKLLVTNEGISGSTLGSAESTALINRYTSLDWANADIATIEYGVNDLGKLVPVGTASDTAGTTTFASCLKTVIEYALAQNPAICLVICTEPDVRGDTQNSNGNTLKDFTDVTLAIAEQYRLPVCDWYYKSGINSLNKGDSSTEKMTADGTHPNDKGHMRMGAMLNQVFDGLLC